MQELTLATGFGGEHCFAYSQFYLTYSTNKVMSLVQKLHLHLFGVYVKLNMTISVYFCRLFETSYIVILVLPSYVYS